MTGAAFPIPVGTVINGRYEVLGYLGSGTSGDVFEVRDQYTQQISALKLLKMHPMTVWDEAQILSGLHGEYILPIRNADLASGVPFIVTEVAKHGTASDALAAGLGVPVDQAVRWAQHASRGVARIHDLGLLHNDLKPENLFISADGDALVGDLGACCLRDAHGNGHFAGTARTMAPEVAHIGHTTAPGDWHLHRPTSVASDIYSLGASLYWLLSGQPAHDHPSGDGLAIMAAVTAGSPTKIRDVAPNVPQGLADIVAKAMARNPSDRYSSAAAFDAALGRRTTQFRTWTRIPAHPGHALCYQGTGHGSDLAACAVPTGKRTQHEIQTQHVSSGRRVLPWPVLSEGQVAQGLRAAFRLRA